MNNIKILEKVICKAKGYPYGCVVFPDILENNKYYRIIFSHDFAKAFWGEFKVRYFNRAFEDITKEEHDRLGEDLAGSEVVNEGWQHHLQQMVLEKEPLKYLETFL